MHPQARPTFAARRLRAVLLATGVALAVLSPPVAHAQAAPSAQAGDAQAVFETLLFRNCQRQAKGLLESLRRELGPLESERPLEDRICGCTVKALTETPKMQALFEGGPEKLKDFGSDKPMMDYMKAKIVSLLLQCTGVVIDRTLDPRN